MAMELPFLLVGGALVGGLFGYFARPLAFIRNLG